jgi:hypothetical protein
MSPAGRVLVFFREVVKVYSCGDVHSLLSLSAEGKMDKAGPLLSCVMNGIDMLGGMMLGFHPNNSRERSVAFMMQHLGLPEKLANVLYVLVRCGVSHEGTTKLTLLYFIDPRRPIRGRFIYRDEGSLWLNVTELAYCYLDAVERIEVDITAHLRHVPVPTARDEQVFAGVDLTALPDFCEYRLAAWKAREVAENESTKGCGEPRSSSSPFLKAHLVRFEVPKTSP